MKRTWVGHALPDLDAPMLGLLLVAPLALSPHRAHGGSARAPVTSEPNIVTPLLPKDFQQAQANSRVHLPGWNGTALYSGFFNIDKATGSNTYFMFSKAKSGRKDAPVVLWLNGGPGDRHAPIVPPHSSSRPRHIHALAQAPRRCSASTTSSAHSV